MTKQMEVLEFVRDHVSVTTSEVSDACGLSTHEAIDVCNELANDGYVGARHQKNTIGMVVWLKQTAAQKVTAFLAEKGASPLLEIAALNGLDSEDVERIVDYLLTQRKVVVTGSTTEDKIVMLRRQMFTNYDYASYLLMIGFFAGIFCIMPWLSVASVILAGACFYKAEMKRR